MIEKISNYLKKKLLTIKDIIFSGDDFLLFLLAISLSAWWNALMLIEAFQLNAAGHISSMGVTIIWLTALTGYTTHKSVSKLHANSLDGQRWGHAFGVCTILNGALIWLLYLLREDVIIPNQLMWGIEGVFANILGWQFFKSIRMSKNGEEKSLSEETNNKNKK